MAEVDFVNDLLEKFEVSLDMAATVALRERKVDKGRKVKLEDQKTEN